MTGEPVSGIEPLSGYTIGLTAERRRVEFAASLERRGATVIQAPAIQIVPLTDDTELRRATERCIGAPLDIVIATTGIGFRGWMEAADTWGIAGELSAALDSSTILARGPKARGSIRAAGLREAWSPESESSSEVLEYLMAAGDLAGKRIAIQLHGEPLADVVQTLRVAGAEVIEVPVYRWILPADTAPLERMVELCASVEVDSVAFTSAPAVVSFLGVADKMGHLGAVLRAFGGAVVAACVGPVTAAPLVRLDVPVIQPERGRLGALVREIVDQVPRRRGSTLPVAGHLLNIRGSAVVIDNDFHPLTSSAMGLLRELARRPGEVVARSQLLALMSSHGCDCGCGLDEHAVEVAIGRLHTALGDQRIIQTVRTHGYRLAYEPERPNND